MKKFVPLIVFIVLSVSIWAKNVEGFLFINFGKTEEEAIKIMENNGYTVDYKDPSENLQSICFRPIMESKEFAGFLFSNFNLIFTNDTLWGIQGECYADFNGLTSLIGIYIKEYNSTIKDIRYDITDSGIGHIKIDLVTKDSDRISFLFENSDERVRTALVSVMSTKYAMQALRR